MLALVKYYAAIKGVFVAHWSMGKVESFITSSVEPGLKELLRNLIDRVRPLHGRICECYLDEQTFRERWSEALELLETVERLIISRTKAV